MARIKGNIMVNADTSLQKFCAFSGCVIVDDKLFCRPL